MEGHPAHKAAIRLAEEGVYVGRYLNGNYFFDPDQRVTRAQFLTMAMSVTGLETAGGGHPHRLLRRHRHSHLGQGHRLRRLKAGAIQGSRDESGGAGV